MSDEFPTYSFNWRPTIGGARITVRVTVKDYGARLVLVSCHQLDNVHRPRRHAALHLWAFHWLRQPENINIARERMEAVNARKWEDA